MPLYRTLILFALIVVGGTPSHAGQSPTLVELYTSQGCSSCPPADAYLSELADRDDVLPLAFHVSYWNYIGWTDPYASNSHDTRQRGYAGTFKNRSIYTPQMVVDGRLEGVGSRTRQMNQMINQAQRDDVVGPELAIRQADDGSLEITAGSAPVDGYARVWMAVYDHRHVTKVLRGENRGRTLVNRNIVRQVFDLGAYGGHAVTYVTAPGDVTFSAGQKAAVIVQRPGPGVVLSTAVFDPQNG